MVLVLLFGPVDHRHVGAVVVSDVHRVCDRIDCQCEGARSGDNRCHSERRSVDHIDIVAATVGNVNLVGVRVDGHRVRGCADRNGFGWCW